MARAIDIGGALSMQGLKVSQTPAEADIRALASDFRVTNKDLHGALGTLRANAEK